MTCFRRFFVALHYAFCLAVVTACPVLHAKEWPKFALPKSLNTFEIGTQVTVRGIPMKLQGFVSPLKPELMAQAFRESMGKPLVENMLGSKLVLGQLRGEYYLSVQIESAAAGSRGVVALSHLKSAFEAKPQTDAQTAKWLAQLPAGSRLLSHITSTDGPRFSAHIVFTNTHSEEVNREKLKTMLNEQGLFLEREGSSENASHQSQTQKSGQVLFFKGPGKEAMATIQRDSTGTTAVAVNTITPNERLK
jgi:hypothetical protein